jgi:hypothetical protein
MQEGPIWIDEITDIRIEDGVVQVTHVSGGQRIYLASSPATLLKFVERSRRALAKWQVEHGPIEG